MEFKLPKKNTCTFILKHDLEFRPDIQLKTVVEDITNGICFKFLPNIIHTINKSDGTYEQFLQNNTLDISFKQHFPYETETSAIPAVSYIFFGDATINNKKLTMNTGYLMIVGNNTYGTEIVDKNLDTTFTGEYSGVYLPENRVLLGNFMCAVGVENNEIIDSVTKVSGRLMEKDDSGFYTINYPLFKINLGKEDVNSSIQITDPNGLGYSQPALYRLNYNDISKYNLYCWTNDMIMTKEQQTILCIYNNHSNNQ